MEKYYSPIKDGTKRKKRHLIFRVFRNLVAFFFPKNEFIWKTEKPAPDEPLFMVCNHTKIYSSTAFILHHQPIRVWANCYFLFLKDCWHHIRTKVCFGKRAWLKPLGFILTPLIVWVFRAFEPIPVYHKSRKVITDTFEKSMQTMDENIPQVIFPERTTNKVNRYIFELNYGFPVVAELYYRRTGKRLNFYPVYCAQKLRKFVVGEPVRYDPEVPMKIQRVTICKYLEDKIRELGDSLPPHEPVIYG